MKKGVIKAVFTLSLFTVIERAIGFGFKIYLSRELGAAQLGVYQVALSVFYVLLGLVTSGIPLVVSKLTAKYMAENRPRSAHALASAAMITGVVTAALMCAVCFFLKNVLGGLFAAKESMTLLLIMLPGACFSAVYAALRGNLWGNERYTLVSIVEIIEQVVRIGVCVVFFSLGFDKMKSTSLAMLLGCAISCLSCVIGYFSLKGKLAPPKGQFACLIKSSLPITAVKTSGSILNSLIALIVPQLLIGSGMSVAAAMSSYGASVGMAMPLLYIPITVIGSLAFVMIPSLSTAKAGGDSDSVKRQVESAIAFSVTLAALFVPVFYELGEPIGILVYDSAESGRFLSFSAWLLIPIAVESITSSMMNSLDLEIKSLINYLIGSAALFAILFFSRGHFTVYTLSIAMGVNLTLSSILDIIDIKRKTKIKLSFIAPLVKSVCLIFPAVLLNRWLYALFSFMPSFFRIACAGGASLMFMILLNIVFSTFDVHMLFKKKRKTAKNTGKRVAKKLRT
ncbi:MAG: oligosaccharide flippase family protein [Clostridia bacterium]|nr:oligosaccharide flippase family protein [Clostridia bacterium]